MRLIATCKLGLESTVAFQLRRMGVEVERTEDARVCFQCAVCRRHRIEADTIVDVREFLFDHGARFALAAHGGAAAAGGRELSCLDVYGTVRRCERIELEAVFGAGRCDSCERQIGKEQPVLRFGLPEHCEEGHR